MRDRYGDYAIMDHANISQPRPTENAPAARKR